MTPQEKAYRVKEILNDPVFVLVFSDIREDLVRKLETAEIGNHEFQHEIALMLHLLSRIKAKMLAYVQDDVVDNHRKRQESFIERLRGSIRP